jgi:hypothetical protein
MALNAGEDEDADNVRIALGNPIPPMLKVEPGLERGLWIKICIRSSEKVR